MSDAWWRDKDEFARRWAAADYNLTALADAHGVHGATTQRWKDKHGLTLPDGLHGNSVRRDVIERRRERERPPLVPILDAEMRLEGDFAVMSDVHLPCTRPDVFERWIDDAERAGLTRAILAGDLFNQDRWSRHEQKQGGAGPDEEREWARWAFALMMDAFDHVYLCVGNHDNNLHRKLDYSVTFDRCMRMLVGELPEVDLDRLTVTGRDYFIVDTDEGEWRICHTYSYSRQPLAYPAKLAMRFGQHVAAGHRHHHAQGYAPNGKRIVELGGAFDEERMAYVHRFSNDLPRMQNGYMLLRDGRADCPMLRD